MRGLEIRIRNQALDNHDGSDQRQRQSPFSSVPRKWQRTYMAEQAAMAGVMVRLDGAKNGSRLRVGDEAQKAQDEHSPPVVVNLTGHDRNLITSLAVVMAGGRT